jgi:hypothetical protein
MRAAKHNRMETDNIRGTVTKRVVVLLSLLGALSVALPVARAARDPKSPRLRPVAADTRIAPRLLLTEAELPRGFRTFKTGASQTNNIGECGAVGQPDLSTLTETAEVYGAGLANRDTGVYYFPSAYVFVTPAEASRAQILSTAPKTTQCTAKIVQARLARLPTKTLGQRTTLVVRNDRGVALRARQTIRDIRVGSLTLRVEASLIFLRRGRAVAEVWTSGPWDAATRKTWNDAVSAVAEQLLRIK